MSEWEFREGVEDLGGGQYAYIQPDGSWGWSNAGLIVDGDECLLVDTLFTLDMTRDMLSAFRDAAPAARHIDCLVNTHSNGDHTFGNQLLNGAAMITSRAAADEMAERPPEVFRESMKAWRDQGEAGRYLHEVMGARFDFEGIVYTPPTETFCGRHDLKVGDLDVELHEFGPAHTRGDVVVHVPAKRMVFTGDLLFINVHPIMWAGPIGRWIEACDRMLSWDVDIVVPGHGPITDQEGIKCMRDYLFFLYDEAKKRFDAGMDYASAAWDIAFTAYDSWADRERVVANVAQTYREISLGKVNPERQEILALMGRYRAGAKTPDNPVVCACGHDHG